MASPFFFQAFGPVKGAFECVSLVSFLLTQLDRSVLGLHAQRVSWVCMLKVCRLVSLVHVHVAYSALKQVLEWAYLAPVSAELGRKLFLCCFFLGAWVRGCPLFGAPGVTA